MAVFNANDIMTKAKDKMTKKDLPDGTHTVMIKYVKMSDKNDRIDVRYESYDNEACYDKFSDYVGPTFNAAVRWGEIALSLGYYFTNSHGDIDLNYIHQFLFNNIDVPLVIKKKTSPPKNKTWEKKIFVTDDYGNQVPVIDPETGLQKVEIMENQPQVWISFIEREELIEYNPNDFTPEAVADDELPFGNVDDIPDDERPW